jgi:glycosyltransferase involved in cell wall biosynthesis
MEQLSRIVLSFFCLISLNLFGFLYHDGGKRPNSPIQIQPQTLPQTKDSHPFDLTVVGKHYIYGSIAKQSVELIQALKNDLSISFIPMTTLMDLHLVSQDVQTILSTPGYRYKGKVLVVEDRITEVLQGGLFERFGLPKTDEKQIRFVYDMCESSRISPKWVEMLNMYDAVLVPDEFLVNVYTESGVTVPIFVLPLGMYMDDFYTVRTPPRTTPHPFVFGNFGIICERKDQLLLVRAFAQAFGNNPNVQLLLSGRGAFTDYAKRVQCEIQKLGLNNVLYEEGCDERRRYLEKFGKIDCYVNISQGEGFSYQPREALFFGVPVIVSDNTAHHTICKSGFVRPVPAKHQVPSELSGCGYMLQCSVDDVATALIEGYTLYSKNQKRASNKYRLQDVRRLLGVIRQGTYRWPLYWTATNSQYGMDSSPRSHLYEALSKGLQAKARQWAQQYDYKNLRPLYLSILSPKRIVLGGENRITPKEVRTTSKALYTKICSVFPNVCRVDTTDKNN